MPITTASKTAQQYFNQGLRLIYGFNHAEAIRAFQEALRLDAGAGMARWGIAYALGPNINAAMTADAERQAVAVVKKAKAAAKSLTVRERDYLAALAYRYSDEAGAQRPRLDRLYADAMRVLATKYPTDLDAATLFAEALMDLSPWDYWTSDGKPKRYTAEIVATLERVLKANPNHPGACHLYIHAVEASRQPERAVPCAERLPSLVPGSGHLAHMPAHIFMRVGRYADAAERNLHGIQMDEAHLRAAGAGGTYAASYYPHNLHFLWSALAMDGRSQEATRAARNLVTAVPPAAAGSGAADSQHAQEAREEFLVTPLLDAIRFGRWDAVLAEAEPAADFPYMRGVWRYARGLAYVRANRLEAADEERRLLGAALDAMPVDRKLGGQSAALVLELATHLLVAELATVRGQEELAIREMDEAIVIEDSLGYSEPPTWPLPVRQSCGAMLLALGKPVEAEGRYREDLRRYPHNGWSLLGLTQALTAQKKLDDAAAVEKRFRAAWARADVTLTASRF